MKSKHLILFILLYRSLLFAQTINTKVFCAYPISIWNSDGNSVSLSFIPLDSVQHGTYQESYIQKNKKIEIKYSFSCDPIFYYQKWSDGKLETLGSYVLTNTLIKNDSILMQRTNPPYDMFDTCITHYLPVRIGTWYYFDSSGTVIQQEYFPFQSSKSTKKKKVKKK